MKMQTVSKVIKSKNSINDFLESISRLPLEDQLMISEIIHKRVIEAKRKEIAKSVKESKAEYLASKTSRGSVDDFLNDIKSE